MVTVVAVLLILAACTNGATEATSPTAPPDAFAPTPTIGGIPTTTLVPTTAAHDERVVLQRVDPVSLQPMTAFEPIPMGDWFWGPKVSPDGRYLAATVDHDLGGSELRLVDLQSWVPVSSWPNSGALLVHVNEFGTIFSMSYTAAPEFRITQADATEGTLVASLPVNYSVWGAEYVTDELFVTFGTRPAEPRSAQFEQVFVATIGLSEGEAVVTETALPHVHVGSVDPVSQGPRAGYLYTSPSFTWDPLGKRLLVVHGDEDVVSEYDIRSGEVIEHPLAGTDDPGTGARRISASSPDGRFLHIATREVELIEDDDDWSVITRPAGVKTIDTNTWEMMGNNLEPISDIWVSPSGGLLGTGYTTEESESIFLEESTGLYLLDGSDLSVRVHYPPETSSQLWGPVSFTESGEIAYTSTWDQNAKVHALEMATGEILSTAESADTLEMIGSVGVLATNR